LAAARASNFPFPFRAAAREAIREENAAAALIPVLELETMASRITDWAETEMAAETEGAETETAERTVELARVGLSPEMSSHSSREGYWIVAPALPGTIGGWSPLTPSQSSMWAENWSMVTP
jgi:hypothetical protein